MSNAEGQKPLDYDNNQGAFVPCATDAISVAFLTGYALGPSTGKKNKKKKGKGKTNGNVAPEKLAQTAASEKSVNGAVTEEQSLKVVRPLNSSYRSI